VKLAVAATPSVAIPTLEVLRASRHTLDLVITQPDRPFGRGKEMRESEVASWARLNSIPTLKSSSSAEIIEAVSDFDCVVTVGYGVLLPQEVLEVPKHGFLNLHFSLLPRWRGAAPVQRSIECGDDISGVCVFRLDRGMDTGPIYVQEKVQLSPRSDALSLFDQLSQLGAPAVLKALELIENGFEPVIQSTEGVTHAAKISKNEACVNWTRPADEIDRQIRAFNAGPISWTLFRGESLRIISANLVDEVQLEPGEVKTIDSQVLVGTGSGSIILEKVVPSGKKEMSAFDWANGARFKVGERVG